MLCVAPGARGLRVAMQACFSGSVQVQCCRLQRSRRVLSYLPQCRRLAVHGAFHHAWAAKSYKHALQAVQRDVERENMTGARQLQAGLQDTLTRHRAGVFFALGRNLTTTCVITRTAACLSMRLRAHGPWMPSEQRNALMALGLPELESQMHRVARASFRPVSRQGLFGTCTPSQPALHHD